MHNQSTQVTEHLNSLDGLRGVAALFVLVAHVCNQTGLLPTIIGANSAQVGVQIFFALSGFLMGRLYLPREPSFAAVASYAVRRIARVVPMYLVVVCASFATTQVLGFIYLYAIDRSNLASHLLFVQATSVLWTVPVEMFFYAVFPLFWLAFRRSKALGESALLLAAIASLGGFIALPWETDKLAFFLVGIAVSRFTSLPRSSILFLTALLLELVLLSPVWERIGNAPLDIWRSPIHLLAAGAVVIAAVHSTLAKVLLANPVTRYCGKISYSIYLLHWPVMSNLTTFTDIELHPVRYLATVLLITLALSSLTFLLIEAPARKLISRVAQRGELAAPPSTA